MVERPFPGMLPTRSYWLLVLGMAAALYLSGGGDWAGWILVLASFVVVCADPRMRSDRVTLVAMFIVLAAHHGASVVNAYFWTLPGAEYDAWTFHRYAVEHIHESQNLFKLRMGSEFYEHLLAWAYLVGGASLFFGQQLSILVFVLACMVFVRLADLIGCRRFAPWLVLLFGALPSTVVLGSITLREGYELCFFILGMYAGLRTFISPVWWALPVCIGSLLAMGMFHQLLMIYALFAVAVLLTVPLWGGTRSGRAKGLAAAGIAAMVVAGVAIMSTVKTGPGNDYLRMIRGGPVQALVEYRRATNTGNPRTAFDVELDDGSLPRLAGSAGLVYAYYLAAPFPWQIDTWGDLVAAVEALLRIILLAAAVVALVRARAQRRILIVLGLMYLSMTVLWAMGTTNYGQAIRHHMLSNWILILAGAPVLMEWLGRRLSGSRPARDDRQDHPG